MKCGQAYVDGGSRGNPGVAGYGVLLLDEDGQVLASVSEGIGIGTNNVAEYSALLAALRLAQSHGIRALQVLADSELLVKQIQGLYQVRHPGLKPLFQQAQSLIRDLDSFSITHIPREQNREADRLANLAMDRSKGVPQKTSLRRVRAVFQNGVFRPEDPLDLPENTRCFLEVILP
ncbi:MAG: reverse transcriptase-like protein [Acidobacteriota bacterium]